jgi:hypothetical protein
MAGRRENGLYSVAKAVPMFLKSNSGKNVSSKELTDIEIVLFGSTVQNLIDEYTSALIQRSVDDEAFKAMLDSRFQKETVLFAHAKELVQKLKPEKGSTCKQVSFDDLVAFMQQLNTCFRELTRIMIDRMRKDQKDGENETQIELDI